MSTMTALITVLPFRIFFVSSSSFSNAKHIIWNKFCLFVFIIIVKFVVVDLLLLFVVFHFELLK